MIKSNAHFLFAHLDDQFNAETPLVQTPPFCFIGTIGTLKAVTLFEVWLLLVCPSPWKQTFVEIDFNPIPECDRMLLFRLIGV